MAARLFDLVLKYGADVALPVERVDDVTRATRWAICKANGGEGGCYDAGRDKCKECGCFMEVKTGARTHRNPKRGMRVEVTHCPLGKWGDLEIAEFYKL